MIKLARGTLLTITPLCLAVSSQSAHATTATDKWWACLNSASDRLNVPSESAYAVVDAAFGMCVREDWEVHDETVQSAVAAGINRYDPIIDQADRERVAGARRVLLS